MGKEREGEMGGRTGSRRKRKGEGNLTPWSFPKVGAGAQPGQNDLQLGHRPRFPLLAPPIALTSPYRFLIW